MSPQTFTIHEVSKPVTGASSYTILNLSSTLSSSASLFKYSSFSSSLIPTGGIWEHLPAFKSIGYLWDQFSKDLRSSTPNDGGSSTVLASYVSSSIS